MKNETKGRILFYGIWISRIAIAIVAGLLLWNWLQPESFWGVLIFIAIWAVVSQIASLLVVFLISLILRDR